MAAQICYSAENQDFDVAIVGAGLSGIAFARFYLDVHPDSRLVIIEKDPELGGTWKKSRIFDTFWTQSALRMTSFADVPLTLPEDAPNVHDSFPAKYVSQYFESYVQNHVYGDRTLRDRIWLDTEVTSVEKDNGGWMLRLRGSPAPSVRCAKLAIASGLTSQPNLPNFPHHPRWRAPIYHHRDFGIHSRDVLSATSPFQYVTVLGGGKSAADMVYASAKSDKHVNWIIRKRGEGAGFLLHAKPPGKYRSAAELPFTLNTTKLNPSGFRTATSELLSLHQSTQGRTTLDEQIAEADRRCKLWANYQGREGALPGFHKLEPTTPGPPGMMQHEDFWDLVSPKVNIYHCDPVGTTTSSIVLEDGVEVPTDVIFAGTGWHANYPFLSSQQTCELGLPHDPAKDTIEQAQDWKTLMNKADQRITNDFPILLNPPPSGKAVADADLTPARLYQGIAPLTDPSVVFLGRARMSNGFFRAEAQAVWATAYWDGLLKLPPPKQAQTKVAYMNAFSRRRYPYGGEDGLNFHKDLIWYVDGLLSEAGLTSHRKGWWEDWSEPFTISDLKDCRDEYLARYHQVERKDGGRN